MPVCPSCDKSVPEQVLCIYCGKHLLPPIKCPGCKRDVPATPGIRRCKYCGGELHPDEEAPPKPKPKPKPAPAETLKTAEAAGMAEMAREVAAEQKKQREFNRVWKFVEAILFVLSLPVIIPSLLLTAVQVKKWGNIPIVLTFMDAALLLALSVSMDNDIALYSVLVACSTTMVLFISRTAQGKGQQGVFLGYSIVVTFLLILGGGLFLPSLVIVCVAAEPSISYGVLGLSLLILGFAVYRAAHE